MAQLLNCRMFQGEAALEDVKKEISNTQVFKSGHKHLVDALSLDTHSLQQWVRAACLSEASGSARYKQWLAMVVKPCLDCTIAFIPANFQDIASRFTAILGGGEATEEDALRLKLACSAIKGELTSHPLVCGLALQCSRFVNKKIVKFTPWQGAAAGSQIMNLDLSQTQGNNLPLHLATTTWEKSSASHHVRPEFHWMS